MNIERFYLSPERKRKRKSIFIRDAYMCVLCRRKGIYKDALIVHHLTPLRESPDLKLNNNNLISVCLNCHNKLHNRNNDLLSAYGIEVKRLYDRKFKQ